ncbi:Pilus assembly protein [Candidatus Sulfobium mesophilum]|uniref:Pilus assembly protein n=1 Tax=Candidatus Sulfobium mesophilum TaxID=2016548 RepID=A0A2U3QGL6_9BACT|nr:Pilus assembly protein [Candidatus Sulfobium mesophilum]
MGRYRPFIFLGLAIVIGLITSLLIYNWLQSKTAVTKATSDVRPVAVAMIDLPAGTVLDKEMIKTVPFLRGSLPEGAYFSDSASLQGKVVLFPVRANEPVLRSRLTPDNISTGGVAAIIDPKKRAMAVKVDKVIGVSGFIHPGNHVDVLVTLHKGDKDATAITKIVLQNMLVLAAGTEMEQRGKNEKPVQVDVITLELTPEEAEKLAHATTQGPIHMALRGYTNSEDVKTRGATIPSLLTGSTPEAVPQSKPHAVRLAKSSVMAEKTLAGVNVDVLVGNKKETKTFKAE